MLKNILTAAALISFLCSCSHTHTVETKDGSVSVDTGKNGEATVHAVGKDGSTVDIGSNKTVTDYPSDAPLYPGKAAMDVKSGEKHGRMLMLQSPDSMEKVSNFYKSELESKGWKVDTTVNSDKMVMYTASKDSRALVVQLTSGASGSGTGITQTLGDK